MASASNGFDRGHGRFGDRHHSSENVVVGSHRNSNGLVWWSTGNRTFGGNAPRPASGQFSTVCGIRIANLLRGFGRSFASVNRPFRKGKLVSNQFTKKG